MSVCDINRREAQRNAFCRGCDKTIKKGEDMISTYSFRNRGQHIHFCLGCAKAIGEMSVEDTRTPAQKAKDELGFPMEDQGR